VWDRVQRNMVTLAKLKHVASLLELKEFSCLPARNRAATCKPRHDAARPRYGSSGEASAWLARIRVPDVCLTYRP
jgi:hypothetical protein